MIYLDNNSTTRVDDEVSDFVLKCMISEYGNPSCTHDFGLEANINVERSKVQIANVINCDPNEIYFTSGATESNNWVINSVINNYTNPVIVTTPIEHPSMLKPLSFYSCVGKCSVYFLNVLKNGSIDFSTVKYSPSLISVMAVNNETGLICDICNIRRYNNCLVHSDITQAIGKIKIDIKKLDLDFASISGHKFHAPKGVGILYVNKRNNISPFLFGGGQQNNYRSGTLNVPGIVGIGHAAYVVKRDFDKNNKLIDHLSELLYTHIHMCGMNYVVNSDVNSVSNTINISFPDVDTKNLIEYLSSNNIYVSGGSACSSNKVQPSYVLKALGCSDKISKTAVRISLSKYNDTNDIYHLLETLNQYGEQLK